MPTFQTRNANPWVAPATAFAVVLVVLGVVIGLWGPQAKLEGDVAQYAAIGESLASGNGYKDTVGPWPDQPAFDRMPGWPTAIAVGLKLIPWAPVPVVVRGAAALSMALAAAFFTVLQRQLGVKPLLALLGGIGMAMSPAMTVFVVFGDSEVLFVALITAGIVGIMAGGKWRYAGAVLCGLTALVRTNYALLPIVVAGLLLLFPRSRKQLLSKQLRSVVVVLAIAITPIFLWAVRNYPLTGRFPFLSSLEGETLYGGNNDGVATNLSLWGYGIVPDQLPGEPIMKIDLAKGHDDLYLNDYYHQKAVAWIKTHLSAMPRLMLGKLIRGFVPVPWVPLAATWAAFSYRFLLDILLLLLARWWWPAMDRLYLLLVFAMFLIVLLTTLVYFGTYRYVHPMEIFYIPCITLGLQQWWRRKAQAT